jgi:hypothetical protein
MARTPWGPRRLVVNGTSIFLGLGRRNRFSLILMTDIVWLRMYVREGEPQYSPARGRFFSSSSSFVFFGFI